MVAEVCVCVLLCLMHAAYLNVGCKESFPGTVGNTRHAFCMRLVSAFAIVSWAVFVQLRFVTMIVVELCKWDGKPPYYVSQFL